MHSGIRRVGSALMWLVSLAWFAQNSITGHGLWRILSAAVLLLGLILAGLTLWERAHPLPKRRRAREREQDVKG